MSMALEDGSVNYWVLVTLIFITLTLGVNTINIRIFVLLGFLPYFALFRSTIFYRIDIALFCLRSLTLGLVRRLRYWYEDFSLGT